MQIKSTRCHLTPVRMAVIKTKTKTGNNKWGRGCGEKRALTHCWWECRRAQPLRETVWRLLKKLRIELSSDPAILLLGISPKELKNIYLQRCMYPYVRCSIIHRGQDVETPQMSFDRGVHEDMAHTYCRPLLSHKERWNTATGDNMDGPREYYARQNKSITKS